MLGYRTFLKTAPDRKIKLTEEMKDMLLDYGMFIFHVLCDTRMKHHVNDSFQSDDYHIDFISDTYKWFCYLKNNDPKSTKYNVPMQEFGRMIYEAIRPNLIYDEKFLDHTYDSKTQELKSLIKRKEYVSLVYDLYERDTRDW